MGKSGKWKPTSADYDDVFSEQNPWRLTASVPELLAPPIVRPFGDILWRMLLHPPLRRHQIILGPRRVGKTTVMYQTVKMLLQHSVSPNRLWWLRLDHPLLLEAHLGQLVKSIIGASQASEAEPVFLFLDELTYADKWDLWLKTFYDERWPVRIVGTSSATAAMRVQGTESGVVRWDEQFLTPYLFTEFLTLKKKEFRQPKCSALLSATLRSVSIAYADSLSEDRTRFMLTGGFPELLLQQGSEDLASELLRSQRVLRSDAIEKALYKDIPQAFAIQDPTRLERLLYSLAGQITGLFSPSTLSADIGLSDITLEKYVKFLERAFIVFTLPNYSASEETVQRRGRRLYFVDGAVRNAALLRGIGPLNAPEEMGLLLENMVASHLNVLAQHSGIRLYHWRHKNQEVDLVYDHPEDPLAFEITGSSRHRIDGLVAFQEKFPRFHGRCFVVNPQSRFREPAGTKPGNIPLDAFLIAVGCQSQFAMEGKIGVRRQESGQLELRFPDS